MKNVIKEEINIKRLQEIIKESKESGGRLVALNGYVDEEKNNVLVYTLEFEASRKTYFVRGENNVPTITRIYRGAEWFEEEIEEMMPIKFEGLERKGRLFLPEEFSVGEGQILIMPLDELKKYKDK
ncbi:MAG: NADH-quinone oxidoreductase subunit C [Clostridium sp.]